MHQKFWEIEMKKISSIALVLSVMISSSWADITCPADSSYHVDMRTMLPDGSPNPTYGLEISTGLCACINFVDGVDITGSEITFTLNNPLSILTIYFLNQLPLQSHHHLHQ